MSETLGPPIEHFISPESEREETIFERVNQALLTEFGQLFAEQDQLKVKEMKDKCHFLEHSLDLQSQLNRFVMSNEVSNCGGMVLSDDNGQSEMYVIVSPQDRSNLKSQAGTYCHEAIHNYRAMAEKDAQTDTYNIFQRFVSLSQTPSE